jgi:glycosyltransferase involved in cell wall biosynthesis
MHVKKSFVSVIIPTYKSRETLKATIESLFRQSYPKDRYEVIVVDDGSSDGTEEMVHSFQAHAPCVLKYFYKENAGPGSARNAGISKARGSIIAFTDSDCVSDVHWIENGVSKMHDGVGLVQGKTLPIPHQTWRSFSKSQEITRENGFYQTCNIFYRKEALDVAGGFSREFIGLDRLGKPIIGGEDVDLAWRVKKSGWKSVFAQDSVVYHHVFHLSPWKVLFRKRKYFYAFHVWPRIIKKHPDLRKILLYYRIFRTRDSYLFTLLVLSVTLGLLVNRVFFLFTIPYFFRFSMSIFKGRSLKTYHRGIAVLIISFLSDLIDFVLLLCGSIRYRSIVL